MTDLWKHFIVKLNSQAGRITTWSLGGAGRMLVKVASLLPVVDASGEEMDQGSMMRYLSEMIFFPAAFLGDNISFQAVDHGSAQVTLRLPAGGKAVWKLPDGDLDYIDVTITELHYDAGAAGPVPAPAPEGRAR